MASEVNNEETTPTAKGIPSEAISSPGRTSAVRFFFTAVPFFSSIFCSFVNNVFLSDRLYPFFVEGLFRWLLSAREGMNDVDGFLTRVTGVVIMRLGWVPVSLAVCG